MYEVRRAVPGIFQLRTLARGPITLNRRLLGRPKNGHRPRAGPIGAAWNCGSRLPLDDILRGIQGSIDPSTPAPLITVAHRRKLKIKRLPVRVKNEMDMQAFFF